MKCLIINCTKVYPIGFHPIRISTNCLSSNIKCHLKNTEHLSTPQKLYSHISFLPDIKIFRTVRNTPNLIQIKLWPVFCTHTHKNWSVEWPPFWGRVHHMIVEHAGYQTLWHGGFYKLVECEHKIALNFLSRFQLL